MRITFDRIKKTGFLDELSRLLNNYDRAVRYMDRLGLPEREIPREAQFEPTSTFWRELLLQIDGGIALDVDLALVANVALELYPGSATFAEVANWSSGGNSEPELEPREWRLGSAIYIRQQEDLPRAQTVIERLREERPDIGRVQQIFDSDGRCAINLPDVSPDLAGEIANALTSEGILPPSERPLETRAVDNADRDGVFQRLVVEGQDQRRFELSDVPVSTAAGDIAAAVLAQYGDSFQTTDRMGMNRPAVIDRVGPDGRLHRMSSDSRLDDAGVQNGDMLHVAQERSAGAVDPMLREDALARVFAQVKDFAGREKAGGRSFAVRANADAMPTLYRLEFDAPSWGPPAESGGQPRPIEHHQVRIELPPDFPMIAPAVFWITPIFHPNIHAASGFVCLGALGEAYRPGLDFSELCLLLVDIASYRNYDLLEGYNKDAYEWAGSPEGMAAIAARGGDPVIARLISSLRSSVGGPLEGVRRRAKLSIRSADE